jgi:hypothetical protein
MFSSAVPSAGLDTRYGLARRLRKGVFRMEIEHFDREEVLEILRDFIEEVRKFLPVVKAVVYNTDIENGLNTYDEVNVAIFVSNYGRLGEIEANDELLFQTEGIDICIAPDLRLSYTLKRGGYVRDELLPGSVEIWSE